VASAAIFGGALLTAATGALAVGAVGALVGLIIHRNDAEYLEQQIDKGRMLLFVRTRDAQHEKRALEILSRHSAHDAKIYSVPDTPPVRNPQDREQAMARREG
jgi:outer membrane lipoprotein SlyB